MIPMEHTIGSSPSRSRIIECWSGGEGGEPPTIPRSWTPRHRIKQKLYLLTIRARSVPVVVLEAWRALVVRRGPRRPVRGSAHVGRTGHAWSAGRAPGHAGRRHTASHLRWAHHHWGPRGPVVWMWGPLLSVLLLRRRKWPRLGLSFKLQTGK